MIQYNSVINWKKIEAVALLGCLQLLDKTDKIRKDSCMKNFHRRLAAALLSAALLATVLPTGALAEEPEELPQANAEPVCTCTIPCTDETRNAECAVCGADGAALEACAAANAADMQTEEDAPAQEEDAVVLLGVQDGVAYVDETGAEQTQDDVAEVTAEDTTWSAGWYVVEDWVNLQDRVMVDGDVRLILADGGYLDAMEGIQVGDGSSLTIYAQEGGTGSLSATSSTIADAAIGGNANENGGAIYIHGGTVRARNDELGFGESDGVAAGIGGGANGDGGTICITGGNVTANGSWNDMGSGRMLVSAGIGGGSNGGSGRITITGGKITAGSGGSGADAIGSGSGGPEGSISITGGDFSSGDLMQNTVCGVAVAEGLFVILKTEDGSSWYHVTDQVGEVDISGGTADVDYTRADGVITILTDTPLTISGNGLTSKERIVIAGGISADLTVKNMEIYTESAPLEISDGSALELTLAGENQLTASDGAGILNRGALTINGSGTLDVQGDYSCAGIETTDGTLVVDSGTIFATGGYNGAGIGGGRGGSGGTITINGGTVTAAGQERAAGIGGGMGGPGGTITINGGTVTALGGYWGAGIGGGGGEPYGNNAGDGGTIEIHGGTVAAVGGSNSGAGIGGGGGSGRGGIYGGVAGNGGSITITGGTVQASANRGAGIGGGGNTTDSPAADLCGAGGVITITGGAVQASSEKGAGIGGGIGGSDFSVGASGGTIAISGGTVTAVSGREDVGIGGGTPGADSGTFSTGENGNAVISATAISDQAGKDSWSGIFFEGTADGKIYGTAITPSEDFTIPADSGLTIGEGQTVTIPDGVTVTIQGSVTGDMALESGAGVQIGDGPAIEVGAGGGVVSSGQTVVLPDGGSVSMGDDEKHTTTVTMPAGGGSVVPDGSGSVAIPAGSAVQTGEGPVITVNGEGTTVAPSGEVTLPGGGTVSIKDGQGNTTTITVPAEGGSIAPNESNGVTVPDGSSIQTGNGPAITVSGEGAAVTPSGEVTLPGNGCAVIAGSQGNTTVTVPQGGGVLTPHDDGSVTLPAGSTVQTGDQTVSIPSGGGLLQPDGKLQYTVTVTFDSQGGSAVTTQKITAGSLLTQPEQPTRSGYRFTGWYQDAACTVAWNFADMPVTSDLTLYAGWKKTSSGGGSGGAGSSSGNSGSEDETSGGQAAQNNPFADVAEDAYYRDAVLWAVENGITAGLTETMFGPSQTCTRAQMVTFLWRAAGSPAPIAAENPFKDVAEGAYYYDAVLWAAEQGITGGTSAGTFSPNATLTRAQTVTFLYRAAGSPAVSGSGFADVAADAYYADAVAWAADQGITSGTTPETFSPAQACTRAQIVTFLYRDRA